MKIKTLIACVFLTLLGTPAEAGVSCALPFTFTNNTVADANQVMANYNAIITCLGNAASAGVNSDITSLVGLSTPLPPSEGGTTVYTGGTSSGSANAQTITTTIPAGYPQQALSRVVFLSNFTNTGPTTFQVGANPAFPVRMRNASLTSYIPLVGGEIQAGTVVDVVFDGSFYILLSPGNISVPTGTIIDFAGTVAPVGYLFAVGQCVSQTTFATLFSVIGSTFSAADSCGAGAFGIPDLRGRNVAGTDFNNGGGFANRLTVGGGNFDSTILGNAGGQQNWTITQAQLPIFTPTGSVSTPAFTGTTATVPLGANAIFTGTPTTVPLGANATFTFGGTTQSYTPAGSNTTPTFSGTPATIPLGVNATLTAGGTTQSFTPTGSNATGTFVTGSGDQQAVIAAGQHFAALPLTTGSNAWTGNSTTVPLGANATFTFGGTTQSYTPAGSNTTPAFSGTAATINLGANATLTAGGTTQSFTPTGSISGSSQNYTPAGSISGSSQNYTPAGSNSTPTFTGNSIGSGNSMPTVAPTMVLNKMIKY